MSLDNESDRLKLHLKQHNQEHLTAFLQDLAENEQKRLLDQIKRLNFDQIDQWVENYVKNKVFASIPENFEPAEYYRSKPQTEEQALEYKKAVTLGQELISHGLVGAVVVAGGQGTRLGFDGPKGDFPISPIKHKTLFQLFAEQIKATNEKYSTKCPWYIMTSPLNNSQTLSIFETNSFYGLDPESIFIFQQGTMPNFHPDGRILMSSKSQIATSPDGHGGCLKALYESEAIDDMRNRGVEMLSYYQVDNPLINIFDPLFIGLHALHKAQMSSKALIKTDPFEKVGNFCLVDGKVTVIEYSDLPDQAAEKRNDDGSLVFDLGSIAIHIINTEFIVSLNKDDFALPLHRAVKKIPYINENGDLIEPDEPNGIKLETFVFDALPLAEKSIILETIREEEFAPVKNASGTDSAESSIQMQIERAASCLEYAGIKVPRNDDGSPDCIIEISPGFALNEQDLKSKADQIPQIKPGDQIYLD
jgi:UDP-N-acetylglucosamine/UDP-N-acetylgalactosamine diphosphorylase